MRDIIDIGPEITLPHEVPPAAGEPVEVEPGIFWLRMPLPFRLDHVNVWLLEEVDGWTAVDCGIDSAETRAIWEALAPRLFHGKPLRRLLATHGHTDHVGLATWMVETFDVPLITTLGEWQSARLRHADARVPVRPARQRFLVAHGCEPAMVCSFGAQRRSMSGHFGPQPESFVRIREGQVIDIGGRRWRVMVCGGHADEHASLFDEAGEVLIAGDQILQRISPMIGVFPGEPEADPLTDYLASLPRFTALPADLLVLPSHGLPFYGLRRRVHELETHHFERLDHLAAQMGAPSSAAVCARHLFPRAIDEGQGRLAFAETLAHLHYLVTTSRVRRIRADDGRILFERQSGS